MTVEVVGEGTRSVTLADDATYADLLRAVDLRVDEATALVDGSPVAEDGPVDPAADVRVLRLIKGGAPAEGATGTTRRPTDRASLTSVRRLRDP